MSLGGEILMAVVGLWAVYLRPRIMRYAGEMIEVMGYAVVCKSWKERWVDHSFCNHRQRFEKPFKHGSALIKLFICCDSLFGHKQSTLDPVLRML
ncbi:hypothetical protein NL676_024162 [Syzygium grande]|nr:hypothetical protein NL676_024162 [Syzygium grande]